MPDNATARLSWRQPALRWALLAWLLAGPLHPVALGVGINQALNNLDVLAYSEGINQGFADPVGFYLDTLFRGYFLVAIAASIIAAIALLVCLGSSPARTRLTLAFAAVVVIPTVVLFVVFVGSPSSASLGNPSGGPPVGWAIIAAGYWAIASLVTCTISYFIIRYAAFRSRTSTNTTHKAG